MARSFPSAGCERTTALTKRRWREVRTKVGWKQYCALSCVLCLPPSWAIMLPSPYKMNGHGKLSRQRTDSAGRPSSARPPMDEHCLSVSFCSMAECRPWGSQFMYHEKGTCCVDSRQFIMFKYCLMFYPPRLRFSVWNVAPCQRLILFSNWVPPNSSWTELFRNHQFLVTLEAVNT